MKIKLFTILLFINISCYSQFWWLRWNGLYSDYSFGSGISYHLPIQSPEKILKDPIGFTISHIGYFRNNSFLLFSFKFINTEIYKNTKIRNISLLENDNLSIDSWDIAFGFTKNITEKINIEPYIGQSSFLISVKDDSTTESKHFYKYGIPLGCKFSYQVSKLWSEKNEDVMYIYLNNQININNLKSLHPGFSNIMYICEFGFKFKFKYIKPEKKESPKKKSKKKK